MKKETIEKKVYDKYKDNKLTPMETIHLTKKETAKQIKKIVEEQIQYWKAEKCYVYCPKCNEKFGVQNDGLLSLEILKRHLEDMR
jgi:uncharacterized protein (UPF0212 family)